VEAKGYQAAAQRDVEALEARVNALPRSTQQSSSRFARFLPTSGKRLLPMIPQRVNMLGDAS
jgi:hypothetical protein